MSKYVIDVCIPKGSFSITKDGEKISGVKSFEFETSSDTIISSLSLTYGETPEYDNVNSYKLLRIETDGSSTSTHVFINGVEQKRLKSIKVKANYIENEVSLSYILYDK